MAEGGLGNTRSFLTLKKTKLTTTLPGNPSKRENLASSMIPQLQFSSLTRTLPLRTDSKRASEDHSRSSDWVSCSQAVLAKKQTRRASANDYPFDKKTFNLISLLQISL